LILHYDSEGDGPLVVLLHGFPEFRRGWSRQVPALARAGFRVVTPDLRGYGDSPKPREVAAYRTPELVDDVARLIESLGGAPCVLVGHDWGAFVAWFTAMIRPDLVRKLVILNVPHPYAFARELKRSRKQKLRVAYQLFFQLPLLPELFMRVFGRTLLRRGGTFTADELDDYTRMWRGSMRTMLHYYRAMGVTRGQLRPLMRRIDVPVLIIWGEREPVFIPDTLLDLEEWVPDLRIERIPRARHWVHHDAPERVNELLIGFARNSP
jgi:epoxide hydrolase 4